MEGWTYIPSRGRNTCEAEVDIKRGHLRIWKEKKGQLLKCTEQREHREVYDKAGGSRQVGPLKVL